MKGGLSLLPFENETLTFRSTIFDTRSIKLKLPFFADCSLSCFGVYLTLRARHGYIISGYSTRDKLVTYKTHTPYGV